MRCTVQLQHTQSVHVSVTCVWMTHAQFVFVVIVWKQLGWRFLCQSAVHRLVASRSSICHTVLHTDGHSQEVSAGYLCTKQKMQKFSLRTRMNRFVVWHTWETQILTGSHSLTGVCELVFCSWYMFERNCFQSYDSLQREEGEYKQTFHSRQVHPVYLKMLSVLTCFMAIEMLLIRLFSSLSNINPQSFLLRTVT